MTATFPGPSVGSPPGEATYAHLNTAVGTLLKTGIGSLRGITVNTGSAGSTLTLYDGTSAAGTVIAAISTATPFNPRYGIQFTTGLFAVVAGTPDVTVCYA
jgi:hypothetical protein